MRVKYNPKLVIGHCYFQNKSKEKFPYFSCDFSECKSKIKIDNFDPTLRVYYYHYISLTGGTADSCTKTGRRDILEGLLGLGIIIPHIDEVFSL